MLLTLQHCVLTHSLGPSGQKKTDSSSYLQKESPFNWAGQVANLSFAGTDGHELTKCWSLPNKCQWVDRDLLVRQGGRQASAGHRLPASTFSLLVCLLTDMLTGRWDPQPAVYHSSRACAWNGSRSAPAPFTARLHRPAAVEALTLYACVSKPDRLAAQPKRTGIKWWRRWGRQPQSCSPQLLPSVGFCWLFKVPNHSGRASLCSPFLWCSAHVLCAALPSPCLSFYRNVTGTQQLPPPPLPLHTQPVVCIS